MSKEQAYNAPGLRLGKRVSSFPKTSSEVRRVVMVDSERRARLAVSIFDGTRHHIGSTVPISTDGNVKRIVDGQAFKGPSHVKGIIARVLLIVLLFCSVPLVSVTQAAEKRPRSHRSRIYHRDGHYYTNSRGRRVHSPMYSKSVPAGATAQCGDGSYSFSQSRRGTCSHHGGVRRWLR